MGSRPRRSMCFVSPACPAFWLRLRISRMLGKRTCSERIASQPAWQKHLWEASRPSLPQQNPPRDDRCTALSATSMPTVKLVLEYDGTSYAGWQRQPDQRTIQEAIERAIHQVSRATVSVIGAGRTDSGVHARGQVASFRTACNWPAFKWTR